MHSQRSLLGGGEDSFKSASASSEKIDSKAAVLEALDSIRSQLGDRDVAAFHICVTVAHADNLEKVILPCVRKAYPKAVIHGLTSSAGVMTECGVCMNEKTKAALSIFAMSDDHGDYIVVSGSKCDTDTVKAKIMEATKDMESPPSMILSALSPGPGAEERVLKGIKLAFKGRKAPPVVGGSSADNDLSGAWRQFSTNEISSSGYSLLLCWPTVDLYVRLVSLHNKTPKSGKITEINGTRTIVKIDGKPAASVYNEWTGGSILESLGGEKLEGNVLGASTCFPLGKYANKFKDTKPSLIHPANVYVVFERLVFRVLQSFHFFMFSIYVTQVRRVSFASLTHALRKNTRKSTLEFKLEHYAQTQVRKRKHGCICRCSRRRDARLHECKQGATH